MQRSRIPWYFRQKIDMLGRKREVPFNNDKPKHFNKISAKESERLLDDIVEGMAPNFPTNTRREIEEEIEYELRKRIENHPDPIGFLLGRLRATLSNILLERPEYSNLKEAYDLISAQHYAHRPQASDRKREWEASWDWGSRYDY